MRFEVAEMPDGNQIYAALNEANLFVAIGIQLGLPRGRICVFENPGDAPLPPITDPDVIEPGEPNPALHANAGSWRKAKSGTFRCKLIHV
jgi:hypothetical protein